MKDEKGMPSVSEIDRYLFDTQGYLIIDEVLTKSEIQRLTDAIPRTANGELLLDDEHPDDGILEYDEPLYRDLINHPRLLPYIENFMTGSPFASHWEGNQIFLCHAHHFFLQKGQDATRFHNGNTPYDPAISYMVREGKIYANFVGVMWCLNEVQPDLGGFWCIPGSHKAHFALPKQIEEYTFIPECAHQPAVSAGSVILFSEALTHGTKIWQAEYERRVLIYKYVSNYLPLLKPVTQKVIDLLTPEQRKYVTFPNGNFVRIEDMEDASLF